MPLLRLTVIALLTLAIALPAGAQTEPLRIVVTTTQAADLLRVLTADVDGVTVTALMGAGVDPHLYKPTEADIAAMSAADLIITSGLNLEGQFGAVLGALRERGIRTLALGDPVQRAGLTIGGFDLSEEFTNVDDPHFWFAIYNWQISADAATALLVSLLPDQAEQVRANADAYSAQLDALTGWAEAAMSSVPQAQRALITSHDAFQYFALMFGWAVMSVQGISTASEAGVGDVQAVIDFVLENDVPVLFVESSVSPATIEAVRAGVRAAGGSVRLGVRELYSDAMGAPDTFGGTYIGMIASNVYTILTSFACAGVEVTLPEWDAAIGDPPPADLVSPDCTAGA
jgi:manganese/zinc/iron transport system substrate-binding protein